MNPPLHSYQPTLPDLLPEAGRDALDFERRILTVKTLGGFAIDRVLNEYGPDISRQYERELWSYSQLGEYSIQSAGLSPGSAPQVFKRWHNLTSKELDIVPITFEAAKKRSFDLSLLGSLVIAETLSTPVTSQLLRDYHQHRLDELISEA